MHNPLPERVLRIWPVRTVTYYNTYIKKIKSFLQKNQKNFKPKIHRYHLNCTKTIIIVHEKFTYEFFVNFQETNCKLFKDLKKNYTFFKKTLDR